MTAYMDKMIGRLMAKLDELKLKENTLLLFMGDNGTSTKITSRFNGADYPGGKGSTKANGTHVPLIAHWPAGMKKAHVCQDLLSSSDILPTLCEAVGINPPEGIDGRSFLPQIQGQRGNPRDWLYIWYSPRQRADLTVKEYAFDLHYKLYRTGEFYALPEEQAPLPHRRHHPRSPSRQTEAPRQRSTSSPMPGRPPWMSSSTQMAQRRPNGPRRWRTEPREGRYSADF